MADEELRESFLSAGPLEGGESFLVGSGGPSPWEKLSQENTSLHRKISELTRENLDLKSRQARIQSDISQFEQEMQKIREEYESSVSQLEAEAARLKEEVKAQKDNKVFLDRSFEALSKQNQALLAKLESLRPRGE